LEIGYWKMNTGLLWSDKTSLICGCQVELDDKKMYARMVMALKGLVLDNTGDKPESSLVAFRLTVDEFTEMSLLQNAAC